jgi:N-acetylglutamate synthase
MNLPNAQTLYTVIHATWPAASQGVVGPWVIREGGNGGSRVSAATAQGVVTADDIPQAEAAMADLGQPFLFQIRETDTELDTNLADLGYIIKDPVNLYAAPIDLIATQRPPPVTCFEVWPPLETQKDIWGAGGISAGRIAVMDRAPHPKTTILGRKSDTPLGTAYVGFAHGCAMIHALEILVTGRRLGLARHMTQAAAFWAESQGAAYMTLVTTRANVGANALYTSLGMQVVGQYHYRIKEDAAA